jgi:hypothetical protein
VPALLGEPELAGGVARRVGLVAQALPEGVEVQDRVRVGDEERRERRAGRDPQAAHRPRPPAGRRPLGARRGDERQQHDPAGVLRRARQPEPDARHGVVAPAPEAQDAGDAPQRQAQRRERGHVVEREVRVEDRQEGDREDAGGEQSRAPVDQPGAGEVQQPDGHGAQQRREHPGDDPHLGGIGREGLRHALAPAEPDREDDVRQVRVGGRVDEVLRVPVVPEEPDRAGDEVRVLVGVVGVGKAVLDAPDAQQERGEQQATDGQRPRTAVLVRGLGAEFRIGHVAVGRGMPGVTPGRGLNSGHRPRSTGWSPRG